MKKYFSHKLPVDSIIIREDPDQTGNYLPSITGKYYPVVKLNDFVFDFSSIDHFDLSFGINKLIPEVSIIVSDDDGNNRDLNWIKQGDHMTIFVGNALDEYHEPIKNNYYITSASNGDMTYSISGILYVPEMYSLKNRVFVNKKSIDIFRFLADEMGLGFVSNITETNDEMNWIQHQPNEEFIYYLTDRSYISDETKIVVFIDQFANLNVVDLKKALTEESTTTFLTDQDGKLLEKDSVFRATNYEQGKDPDSERYAILDGYSPINREGRFSLEYSRILNVKFMEYEKMEVTDYSIDSKKETLKSASVYTSISTPNTFPEYEYAKELNRKFNNNILSKQQISGNFGNFYPQVFLFQTLPIDIYEEYKMGVLDSQLTEVNSNNFEQKVDMENGSFQSNKLNEEFTGNYMVLSMNYTFSYESEVINMVRQNMNFIKIS